MVDGRDKNANECPCCGPVIEVGETLDRRRFLKTAGGMVAAAGLGAPLLSTTVRASADEKVAEDYVKTLYQSLKPEQREKICFDFDHPLRKTVRNNWHIVPQKIGEFLDGDQQELCRLILKGITTEDGFDRFQRSMKDDDGGLGNYSCALFGDPAGDRYQWVLTGRHITLRADGNTTAGTAFGGPIFYGHAVTATEMPDHPGNVWWHQGRAANELFKALDGAQREKALLKSSPADSDASIRLRGSTTGISGLAATDMSKDQQEQLEKLLKTMLSMFREQDVKEVVECLKKHGGLESASVQFFPDNDLGNDGVWDRWRVEAPTFVWYFRGSPHVHTWVNIRHEAPKWV